LLIRFAIALVGLDLLTVNTHQAPDQQPIADGRRRSGSFREMPQVAVEEVFVLGTHIPHITTCFRSGR
jgi:hypothetical protein